MSDVGMFRQLIKGRVTILPNVKHDALVRNHAFVPDATLSKRNLNGMPRIFRSPAQPRPAAAHASQRAASVKQTGSVRIEGSLAKFSGVLRYSNVRT